MAEIVDFGLQKHKIKMDSRYFDNVLSVVAGDTGRRIEVQLLDTNGMVQNTTGLNLRLNAEIAGKATYTDATLVDAVTGKYRLDLSNGMFLAPGNWQFQWQITDSAGKKLHSFAFTGNIGKNISEGGSQATNFYLNLEDLKAMQDDLINGTIDSSILETNIAEKLTDLETQYAPKLTEVTAQLAQTANKTKWVTPESFGAVGDGVANDLIAFQDTFNYCVTNNIAVYLYGSYKLTSATSVTLDFPSIIGNNSTLYLDGFVKFVDTSTRGISVTDITVVQNVGRTADSTIVNSLDGILRKENGNGIKMSNITFESDELPTNTRKDTFLFVKNCENVNIKNVITYDTIGSIFVFDSVNVTVEDIYAENCEVNVRFTRVTNGTAKRIEIKNTKEQQVWWAGINTGVEKSGKNCFLSEGTVAQGGDGLVLDTVIATHACERTIYCQTSNVRARNLYSYNSVGIKFVGIPSEHVKNVDIDNVVMTIDTEDAGPYRPAFLFYWIEDVTVKNLTVTNKRTDGLTTIVHIDNGTHNIKFLGVNLYNVKTPKIVRFQTTHSGDLTISNISFENLYAKNSSDTHTSLFDIYNGSVEGFSVDGVYFRDVFFDNDYDNSTRYLYYREPKVTNLVIEDMKYKNIFSRYRTFMVNVPPSGLNSSFGTLKNSTLVSKGVSTFGLFSTIEDSAVTSSENVLIDIEQKTETASVNYSGREMVTVNTIVDGYYVDSISNYKLDLKTNDLTKNMLNFQFPFSTSNTTYKCKLTCKSGVLEFMVNDNTMKEISDSTDNFSTGTAKSVSNPITVKTSQGTSGKYFIYLDGLLSSPENIIFEAEKI